MGYYKDDRKFLLKYVLYVNLWVVVSFKLKVILFGNIMILVILSSWKDIYVVSGIWVWVFGEKVFGRENIK